MNHLFLHVLKFLVFHVPIHHIYNQHMYIETLKIDKYQRKKWRKNLRLKKSHH